MPKVKIDPGPFVLPMPVALVGATVNGKPNFMTAAFAGIMNAKPPVVACGLKSGKKHDKSQIFKTFTGSLETAPMIEACRLTAECWVIKAVAFEVDTVFFGEVISVYTDDTAAAEGSPDWEKINPLLFTFPDKGYWQLGSRIADAWSVGKNFKP